MSIGRGISWVLAAQAVRIGFQIVGLIVLTRLLTPHEYGLAAMLLVVSNFASLFRDLGTGSAIIQRRALENSLVVAVMWLNLALGFASFLVVAISSQLIASFFRAIDLIWPLVLTSFSFPFSSLGVIQQAQLERQHRFKTVTLIDGLAGGASLLLALLAALSGWGVYSLVVQSVASAVLTTTLLWAFSDWRPSGRPQWNEFRQIAGFTFNISGFTFINFFSRNLDSILIARYLGMTSLGPYSLAYRLMLFPVQNLTYIVSRALYPAMSRRQESPQLVGSLFLATLTLVSMLTFPSMILLWLTRDEIIPLIFGDQWLAVPPLLAWLAPTGAIQSLISCTGVVFLSCGRPGTLFRLSLVGLISVCAAFIVGVKIDIQALAAMYLIANILNAVPVSFAVRKVLHLTWYKLLQSIIPSIICSVTALALILAASNASALQELRGAWRVIVSVSVFCVIYSSVAWLGFRNQLQSVRRTFSQEY